MMKRSILVALVFLFTVSTIGQAQQSNAAETVYNRWSQEASADELSKLRFALATVARRTSNEAAEVEFWAVGKTSQTVFEIRPLYFEKLPDGGFKQEQAGEVAKTVVGNSGAGRETGNNVGLKMDFHVRPNTNALEIKWMGYDGGELRNSTTIQVLLRDEQSENLTRISSVR